MEWNKEWTREGEYQTLSIHTPYITLGQLLKRTGVIDTGGAAKPYLADNEVLVNGVREVRRGRKVVPGDTVTAGSRHWLITRVDNRE